MKIKAKDLEAFMQYYYKQNKDGKASEEIILHFEDRGFYTIFEFLDDENNWCKVNVYESASNIAPKLVKEMVLESRLKKGDD